MLPAGWVLLGLIATAAPPPVRFTFEWGGVPVGTVEFEGRCYRSTHLFARGPARVRTDCETQGVSWRLLHRRTSPGCTAVREELTGREGRLCLTRRNAAVDEGTAFEQPFTARYRPDGTLEELVLGSSRFVRSGETPGAPAVAPLADGFELSEDGGGALEVRPAAHALRWRELPASVLALADVERDLAKARAGLGDGECLVLARRLVERLGDSAEIVYGLVEEGGRVFPHAWVRVHTKDAGTVELDGALRIPVRSRTHLALASTSDPGGAGAIYVALFERRAEVIRTAAATRTE